MMSEFKKVIQEVKKDNKCVKKIVIPIESYFTESIHDPNGTPRYFFMPVSQSFYNKQRKEFLKMASDDLMIVINQIILKEVNTQVLVRKHIDETNKIFGKDKIFRYLKKHSKKFYNDNKVITLRSQSEIFFKSKVIHRYLKQFKFSELLKSVNDSDIPDVYKKVIFTNHDDSPRNRDFEAGMSFYEKFFFMEICFDHFIGVC